jgi:hypothetical protein
MRIIKREHIWDGENDRWILNTTDVDGKFGLNFMQGDDYEAFVEHYNEPDLELTKLYAFVSEILFLDGVPVMEVINRTCWAWLNLKGV